MERVLSNNWSHCFSKHLYYENDLAMDDRLCFVLASAMGLRLAPRKPLLFGTANNGALWESYINPLNGFTTESFANIGCHEVFYFHKYGEEQSKKDWIIQELIRNDGKFLVTVSNAIFNTDQSINSEENHFPISAILSMDRVHANLNVDAVDLEHIMVTLEINNEQKITITATAFCEAWMVDHALLNGNITVCITTTTKNDDEVLKLLVKSALSKQLSILQQEDESNNVGMLRNLRMQVLQGHTEDVLSHQREMLQKSFDYQKSINELDMNRGYFSDCLKYISERGLIDAYEPSISYQNASSAWIEASHLVSDTDRVLTKEELVEVYDDLIEKEVLALHSLEKAIS